MRGMAVSPILKSCATLRFLLEGTCQKCSGNTISIVAREVLNIMEHHICVKWITPQMIKRGTKWFIINILLKNCIPESAKLHRFIMIALFPTIPYFIQFVACLKVFLHNFNEFFKLLFWCNIGFSKNFNKITENGLFTRYLFCFNIFSKSTARMLRLLIYCKR